MPNFSYSKKDKLKSKTTLDLLFSSGQSVKKFPIRIVYNIEDTAITSHKIGVSVSKRNFKKAVDRNRIKRLLREAYRLNKDKIKFPNDKSLSMMIFYQNKEMPDYQFINLKMIQVLEKLNAAITTPVQSKI